MTYFYHDGTRVPEGRGYLPHKSTRFIHLDVINQGNKDKLPELYEDRSLCCGCSACANACPVNAIAMKEDEEGFLYPVIDALLCIECKKCLSSCAFKVRVNKKCP